ncbi:hypothetical protein Tco_0250169, partial [Tanacetum coccineum]
FGKHLEEKNMTWAQFKKKLNKNANFQAGYSHPDAFIKSAQKDDFWTKSVTSQAVETASQNSIDAVRIT